MAARKDCYTDEQKAEVAAYVLINVACGRFVSRVFREDKTTDTGVKLPNAATFWRWVLEDETGELDEKLVRARERGIEALLDETIDIADDGRNDTYLKELPSGLEVEAVDSDVIQRSKLRIETRIKLAQMLKPKTYGPKLDLTSGNKPIGIAAELEAARLRAREVLDGKLP